MATPFTKTIKRELTLDDRTYTVTMSPDGVKITPKGGRLGREISWRMLLAGQAENPGKPEGLAENP